MRIIPMHVCAGFLLRRYEYWQNRCCHVALRSPPRGPCTHPSTTDIHAVGWVSPSAVEDCPSMVHGGLIDAGMCILRLPASVWSKSRPSCRIPCRTSWDLRYNWIVTRFYALPSSAKQAPLKGLLTTLPRRWGFPGTQPKSNGNTCVTVLCAVTFPRMESYCFMRSFMCLRYIHIDTYKYNSS